MRPGQDPPARFDAGRLRELGLVDPGAPGAADRLATLSFLVERGATEEMLVAAARTGRLAGLAADMLLRPPGPRRTQRELAEAAGMPVEVVARVFRAAGFPDPDADAALFDEADAEVLRSAAAAMAVFGEEPTVQFTRALGASVARVAEAAIALFETSVAGPLTSAEAGELAMARANADAAGLLPGVVTVMDGLLRRHFTATIDRLVTARAGERIFGRAWLCVGFADVCGFTALAQQLSGTELAALLTAFEALCAEVVTAHGGHVVKLIGDEVMFVTPSAATGCRIALALAAQTGGEAGLPPLRQGLAGGELLTRDGDYFGSAVNLAARVAALADPGGILVDAAVRARAEPDLAGVRFRSRGARRLRGFAEAVPVHALRDERGA